MPSEEMADDVPQKEATQQGIACDLCGSPMVPVGGCFFCRRCGQKKCNTDLT